MLNTPTTGGGAGGSELRASDRTSDACVPKPLKPSSLVLVARESAPRAVPDALGELGGLPGQKLHEWLGLDRDVAEGLKHDAPRRRPAKELLRGQRHSSRAA